MKQGVALLVLLFCWILPAQAQVRMETIDYKQGATQLEGYIAYDDSIKGRRPGVLIVHEWWGITPYVKKRAEQVAQLGYIAFAADIYGRGIRAETADKAGELAKIYLSDRKLLRARALAGLDILKQHPLTDKKHIAAIGYCFGGTTVLELARSGAPVQGVASFHGLLNTPTPEDARNIRAKVLVLQGADDPYAPAEQVKVFEDEMRKGGVDWQLNLYGGAVHSFTNPAAGNDPSKGAAYNAEADRRSWEAMKLFFQEIL